MSFDFTFALSDINYKKFISQYSVNSNVIV